MLIFYSINYLHLLQDTHALLKLQSFIMTLMRRLDTFLPHRGFFHNATLILHLWGVSDIDQGFRISLHSSSLATTIQQQSRVALKIPFIFQETQDISQLSRIARSEDSGPARDSNMDPDQKQDSRILQDISYQFRQIPTQHLTVSLA